MNDYNKYLSSIKVQLEDFKKVDFAKKALKPITKTKQLVIENSSIYEKFSSIEAEYSFKSKKASSSLSELDALYNELKLTTKKLITLDDEIKLLKKNTAKKSLSDKIKKQIDIIATDAYVSAKSENISNYLENIKKVYSDINTYELDLENQKRIAKEKKDEDERKENLRVVQEKQKKERLEFEEKERLRKEKEKQERLKLEEKERKQKEAAAKKERNRREREKEEQRRVQEEKLKRQQEMERQSYLRGLAEIKRKKQIKWGVRIGVGLVLLILLIVFWDVVKVILGITIVCVIAYFGYQEYQENK